MTKYYVYHVKHDDPEQRIQAFVEDPMVFALSVFNPATMEFSGVFVEANDSQSAQQVYLHPQENDVFVSCDEPRPTELKRRAFESRLRLMQSKLKELKESLGQAEVEARKLRTQSLILEIANDFNRLAVRISELARTIRATADSENKNKFSDEQIYERLIQKYAEQLPKLKYRPGLGGTLQG